MGEVRVDEAEEMTCWPVSARVGNVKNNDPSLIEPIAA
jgi:putative SOS response-associated peptidase YedK